MNSRPIFRIITEIMIPIWPSILTCQIREIMIDTNTAREIRVSLKVSAPLARRTSE